MNRLYLTIPFGRTWHVFGEDDRALCGKAMMLRKNPNACEEVTGKEHYRKGQDCKACFRKAGLTIPEDKRLSANGAAE